MRRMAREHSRSFSEHGNEPLGTGAPKVLVHGGRAWRAIDDVFQCKTDGPESVPAGHSRVLVQGRQAVRVGDFLLGAGAPDEIQDIDHRVVLGEDGVGLESDEGMQAWCREWCALEAQWPTMTEDERKKAFTEMAARMFAQFGAPAPKVVFIPPTKNPDGTVSYSGGYINVGSGEFGVGEQYFSSSTPGDLRRVTFHETRHGEQLFNGVRYARQQRRKGTPIPGDNTGDKNPALVAAADAMPDFEPGSKEEAFGRLHANGYSRDVGLNQLGWANGDYGNRYKHIPGGADAGRTENLPMGKCAC